ncbi:MAG TPA: hypothetical protein VGM01_04855 [Ktedonobacteraceae bacterium]
MGDQIRFQEARLDLIPFGKGADGDFALNVYYVKSRQGGHAAIDAAWPPCLD